jgi:hypothetical protein
VEWVIKEVVVSGVAHWEVDRVVSCEDDPLAMNGVQEGMGDGVTVNGMVDTGITLAAETVEVNDLRSLGVPPGNLMKERTVRLLWNTGW